MGDDRGVTWCESTVGVADDEDVDLGIVYDRESPQHRSQFLVDVTQLGTQLAQSHQHAKKVKKKRRFV